MSARHPGGDAATLELIEAAGLRPPCRIVDLGAGDGDAVRLLRSLGLDATGLDLAPGADVEYGDLLDTGLPDGSVDAALSQCSFFVTGSQSNALRETRRILRPGGLLLISDVFPAALPAAEALARSCGLTPLWSRDLTALWREYYIEKLWSGEAEPPPPLPPGAKPGYYMLVCRKEG